MKRANVDHRSSKSALHGLIHWLAQAYSKKGITVNGVAPALIQGTAMLSGGKASIAELEKSKSNVVDPWYRLTWILQRFRWEDLERQVRLQILWCGWSRMDILRIRSLELMEEYFHSNSGKLLVRTKCLRSCD